MTNYSYDQINEALITIVNRLYNFDYWIYLFFKTQYDTGLRFEDLHNLNRWTVTGINSVNCETAKYSEVRTFNNTELPDELVNAIHTGTNIFQSFSYWTAVRYFKHYSPIPQVWCLNKAITSHLFRHRFAKDLKQNKSLTDDQIKTIMGEKNLTSAMSYIYSNLYSK